jgi:cobalt-precorrin 5A hydrolase
MKLAVVALTKRGSLLGMKIAKSLGGELYINRTLCSGGDSIAAVTLEYKIIEGQFKEFVGKLFEEYTALIFVMACGIVVRAISPYLVNKTKDPAVVVVDELGKYAISLLSGHLGGGNELSERVAEVTDGEAVITTATDINGVFAFDMFAKRNDLNIENIENLKFVSAALLDGRKVFFYSEYPVNGEIPENVECEYLGMSENMSVSMNMRNNMNLNMRNNMNLNMSNNVNVVLSNKAKGCFNESGKTLYIRPKNLIIGIGCRKDTKKEDIKEAILDFLNKSNKSIYAVKHVASAEIKKDEEGIISFCNEFKIPFVTVSLESIKQNEDKFSHSDFVKNSVGVGGVCEAASVLSSNSGKLIVQKTLYKGITLALAEEGGEFSI